MKKLYPRICSNCGRRFVGKKMDYTCPICIDNKRVTIEVRGNRVIETRGQCCISSRCGVISQGDTRTLAEIQKPCISKCVSVWKSR